MKQSSIFRQWLPAAVFGMILAASAGTGLAVGDLILNTFDSAAELTASGNDWFGGSATWDGTVDAGGGAGTGSMHVTAAYSNPDPTSWQETQVTRNIPW